MTKNEIQMTKPESAIANCADFWISSLVIRHSP